jgi:hypothetical protein
MITTGADKGKYIVPVSGYYTISGGAGFTGFDADNTTILISSITVDSSIKSQTVTHFGGTLAGVKQPSQNVNDTLYLEKGQSVHIDMYFDVSTTTGTTRTTIAVVPERTTFSIARLK